MKNNKADKKKNRKEDRGAGISSMVKASLATPNFSCRCESPKLVTTLDGLEEKQILVDFVCGYFLKENLLVATDQIDWIRTQCSQV